MHQSNSFANHFDDWLFHVKILRKRKRIFSVTIFGTTASCATVYGIMQCLQTIYYIFGVSAQ